MVWPCAWDIDRRSFLLARVWTWPLSAVPSSSLASFICSFNYLAMILSVIPSQSHDVVCLIGLHLFITLCSFFFSRKKKWWRKCSWNPFLAESSELCLKLLVKCLTFFLSFINIMGKSFRILMESNFPLMQAVKRYFLLKLCLGNKQYGALLHSKIPPTNQQSSTMDVWQGDPKEYFKEVTGTGTWPQRHWGHATALKELSFWKQPF